mmetsp:Transcript_10198/g.28965  ORF Transcript_10198/g.28965 Transcript_10198/m.28965 type:complete len:254 (+) Transcript_10198:796-1557(+)
MSYKAFDNTAPPYSMTRKMSLFVSVASISLVMCRMPGEHVEDTLGAPPGAKSISPMRISLQADRTSALCFWPEPFATCLTATSLPFAIPLASQTAPQAPFPSKCFFVYSGRKRPPYSRSTSASGARRCNGGAADARARPRPPDRRVPRGTVIEPRPDCAAKAAAMRPLALEAPAPPRADPEELLTAGALAAGTIGRSALEAAAPPRLSAAVAALVAQPQAAVARDAVARRRLVAVTVGPMLATPVMLGRSTNL